MRFRFTIFLLIANIALFGAILGLEREKSADDFARRDMAPITVLEIEGKNIDKPRVLKLENNKWRITTPIDWPANLFAVNRIINQLEFLEKETGFSVAEAAKSGHGLSEYGLDAPAYIFKYGNGEKMYTLKVGKGAPVGNRIYLLDSFSERIVVVDKEFVDGLIVDMERLRNQSVFDIPRFEVSAFSIRLPITASPAEPKTNFLRIGFVNDAGKWKMETPIAAAADPREVDSFLDEICRICAVGFPQNVTLSEAGFDGATLPAGITIQGTNRREVLQIGAKTKDGKYVYARLEDNPTIFTLETALFKNLDNLQTTLRDKSFFRFDSSRATALEISQDGESVRFHKLTGGLWDVSSTGKSGEEKSSSADLSVVGDILNKLSKVRARQFVSDAAVNISQYGIVPNGLRISVTQDDGTTKTIQIGSEYMDGGEPLMYAKTGSGSAVYGISKQLAQAATTDFLKCRSKILESLPEKAVISSVKIVRIADAKVLFEVESSGTETFAAAVKKFDSRKSASIETLAKAAKTFTVSKYIGQGFSEKGISIDGNIVPWKYLLTYSVDLPGGATGSVKKLEFYLTQRLGGITQYGGFKENNTVFIPNQNVIDAVYELISKADMPVELKKESPIAPTKR